MIGPIGAGGRRAFIGRLALAVFLGLGTPAVSMVAPDTFAAEPRTVAAGSLSVRFEAGPHTGHRFDSSGRVIASKAASLSKPSSATATARTTVAGRGVHFQVSTGIWAGYAVPETSVSYVRGVVGETVLAPPTRVRFAAGTYLGYRFDARWALAATKAFTLRSASSAPADRAAVIDGRPYVRVTAGVWAGHWMPGTAAAPLGVACRPGPRVPAGSAQAISRGPSTGSRVALTFDLGGRTVPAMGILERLVLERACTTIFPTGKMAATAEGRAILAYVRSHPELFEVGNHTQRHCDLVHGGGGAGCPSSRPSSAFVAAELTTAAAAIRTASGQNPVPYWRPPYGAWDSTLVRAAGAAGYTKAILWTVDTIDWRPAADGGPTALTIVTKVRAAGAGSIVLMHLGGYNTLDALPSALFGLRERGMLPTTISELLR